MKNMETFEITLTDSDGSVIRKKEFSENEKEKALDFWSNTYRIYLSRRYNAKITESNKDCLKVVLNQSDKHRVYLELVRSIS